jgi:spore germination protein YaaH
MKSHDFILSWALLSVISCGALVPAQGPVAQFYFVEDRLALESLRANVSRIGVLSPVWVMVSANGKVTHSINLDVARLAAKHHVPIMPVVMNRDFDPAAAVAVLGREDARIALADELARLADKHHFAGLQLDFEAFGPELADAYVDLTRRLAAKLHERDKKLSVAVPSPLFAPGPPATAVTEWQATDHAASFRYQQLGQAADWITLMAYDQYVMPDQPGPIAGLEWVEACIQATTALVPPDRVLLGLPMYHRHWDGRIVSTGTHAEALAKVSEQGAVSEFDGEQHEMRSVYSRGGVPNEIWFQNAASLRRRLELVSKYKLGGFSAWRLGQEDPAVWKELFKEGD